MINLGSNIRTAFSFLIRYTPGWGWAPEKIFRSAPRTGHRAIRGILTTDSLIR